ncbi:alpha/beta hydrolase family protein [Sphingomonas sp. UNC305MFCol5.2]|uniref:alpha/beta hydrolase family protein n=1 Tax=Sphingomonas sp. UNC305MFCol5.2 TaxID=1449076 RepID=UPI0006765F14|nr:S9 family peptidase [Sphingomonas sp. UNC305MFCol5.2]
MLLSPPAMAQTGEEIVAKFAARETVRGISLSPDGSKVAIISAAGDHGEALLVADLVAGSVPKQILAAGGNPDRLRFCRWASNTRLVCGVYMIAQGSNDLSFTRLIAVNNDGSKLQVLTGRAGSNALGPMQQGGNVIDFGPDGSDGSVLMTREIVPEYSTGTQLAERRSGMAVELVEATTMKRRLVEQPRKGASEYISDGHGKVRIYGLRSSDSSGYLKSKVSYFYRLAENRDWEPLSVLTLEGGQVSGFDPYAVDPAQNLVYGFDDKDGRRALYSISLDGKLTRSLVLAHPQVDVDTLIRVGRQRRVVGVSYATDRRQAEFFDPELRKLQTALAKALPKTPLLEWVDASADESKLLLWAGSDSNPGIFYRYDKAKRALEELMPVRKELAGMALATVKPVDFPAADGTRIPGYLTLPPDSDGKNLPTIVMPHGGPGARDEWTFDWLPQFFAARGYAVLQPNFRGSTGYGSEWFQKNGFQSWRTAIGDVNDGGRWLLKEGIAAPGKLAIVGWSYGGYAALQSAVLDPGLFKAIVAVAPVTDLETLRSESRRYVNYPLVDRFIGNGPHIREGSPARNAGKIKAPVLLFHGDLDENVGVGESRMMQNALKDAGAKVDYVEFKNLDHQLDSVSARKTLLGKSDAFLRAALGLQP